MAKHDNRRAEIDSYTEVWQAIKRLRQREGMARQITEEQASALIGLSAVEDQADFAGHGSRVLAVDEVLRCIATRLSNPVFRIAYSNALNLEGIVPSNLLTRRENLRSTSGINGRDEMTNLEDDAFKDAAQLLLRTGTCLLYTSDAADE